MWVLSENDATMQAKVMLKLAARCEVAEECKRVHGVTLAQKIGEAYERHCHEFLKRS